MTNKDVICPHCGKKTPKVNFCANCGKSIEIGKEKFDQNTESDTEIINSAFMVSETSKSRFGGKSKNLFFTTNYILEDKASNIGFMGNAMSMEDNGPIIDEDINEEIDINQVQQENPDLRLIPYTEIEKAEFYTTRWNTYLEIITPTYSPQYLLGAKKFSEAFLLKIRELIEPKIGDRFKY